MISSNFVADPLFLNLVPVLSVTTVKSNVDRLVCVSTSLYFIKCCECPPCYTVKQWKENTKKKDKISSLASKEMTLLESKFLIRIETIFCSLSWSFVGSYQYVVHKCFIHQLGWYSWSYTFQVWFVFSTSARLCYLQLNLNPLAYSLV